jgi:hypothetical protein
LRGANRRKDGDFQKKSSEVKHGTEDLALPAYLHLALPITMNLSIADRSADKPTEMPTIKLPCRALLLYLYGAVLNVPTGYFSIPAQNSARP